MDHRQVRRYWDRQADLWTRLVRAGYDTHRDYVNTPAFFDMLPPVDGLRGLDIGCGEGYNTRLLAGRRARVAALDVSEVFVHHAQEPEVRDPLGIGYHVASAVHLPFAETTFDFATAFMSFMDVAETDVVLTEAYRVLKPGGFLQFSITHPCFDTPHRRKLVDETGSTYAIEIRDYFRNLQGEVVTWLFGAVPPEMGGGLPRFEIPRFTRTLSQWFNLVVQTGFVLERIQEPRTTDEAVRVCPDLQDGQVVPFFLHVRARRPPTGPEVRG